MSASGYVHLEDCQILSVTPKAIYIDYEGLAMWIPISQIADGEDHKFERGDKNVTVSITEWIAGQKGIEIE